MFTIFGGFSGAVTSQNEQVEMGWTGGGGAEWAFTNLFRVGLKYRHNEFDDIQPGIRHQGPVVFSQPSNAGLDSGQLTLRLNVPLGRGPPEAGLEFPFLPEAAPG